jgi:hypothetical protein
MNGTRSAGPETYETGKFSYEFYSELLLLNYQAYMEHQQEIMNTVQILGQASTFVYIYKCRLSVSYHTAQSMTWRRFR